MPSSTPPLLLLSRLSLLLSYLTHPSGSPHSALLLDLPSGGSILASHSTPTQAPFPPSPLEEEGEGDGEERKRCYAALAVGSWEDQRGDGKGKDEKEPVMLETEVRFFFLFPPPFHFSPLPPAFSSPSSPIDLMMHQQLGRIALVPLGNFLLVLIGNQVAPWKVLDKKVPFLPLVPPTLSAYAYSSAMHTDPSSS
jgi:hypothetical protein